MMLKLFMVSSCLLLTEASWTLRGDKGLCNFPSGSYEQDTKNSFKLGDNYFLETNVDGCAFINFWDTKIDDFRRIFYTPALQAGTTLFYESSVVNSVVRKLQVIQSPTRQPVRKSSWDGNGRDKVQPAEVEFFPEWSAINKELESSYKQSAVKVDASQSQEMPFQGIDGFGFKSTPATPKPDSRWKRVQLTFTDNAFPETFPGETNGETWIAESVEDAAKYWRLYRGGGKLSTRNYIDIKKVSPFGATLKLNGKRWTTEANLLDLLGNDTPVDTAWTRQDPAKSNGSNLTVITPTTFSKTPRVVETSGRRRLLDRLQGL